MLMSFAAGNILLLREVWRKWSMGDGIVLRRLGTGGGEIRKDKKVQKDREDQYQILKVCRRVKIYTSSNSISLLIIHPNCESEAYSVSPLFHTA